MLLLCCNALYKALICHFALYDIKYIADKLTNRLVSVIIVLYDNNDITVLISKITFASAFLFTRTVNMRYECVLQLFVHVT